jgi:hypothetical protein
MLMPVPTLDDIARELYAVNPDEFTAARDERAAQAKSAGDTELARQLRKLRRPTTSAWLVNLLCHERSDELNDLLELAERFREEGLTGQRMRELSEQRRRLVRRLLGEVERLAADAGVAASAEVIRQVEATLGAAVADAQAAELVRGGRLDKPLSYVGFGPSVSLGGPGQLRAVQSQPAKPARREKPDPGELAKRKLTEAKAAVEEAERDVAERTTALENAERDRDIVRTERDEVRTELEHIRTRLRDLETRFAAKDRGVRAEEKRLERAERRLSDARRELSALDPDTNKPP